MDLRAGSWMSLFQVPFVTRQRVRLAYGVAIAADVIQVALGPFGWAFADEIIDLAAAFVTWRLLGFHPLLLPTFLIELLPVTDLLPTWTGCVALVVARRRREQGPERPPPEPGRVIDV